MHIIYTNPVDGIERAREVKSYEEAKLLLDRLEAQGVDPSIEEDVLNAKPSCLPLLVSPWRQSHIIPTETGIVNSRTHQAQEIIL